MELARRFKTVRKKDKLLVLLIKSATRTTLVRTFSNNNKPLQSSDLNPVSKYLERIAEAGSGSPATLEPLKTLVLGVWGAMGTFYIIEVLQVFPSS